MAYAGRGSDQFPVRLPEGMRDRIKARAQANGRSMNTEIIHLLEKGFGDVDAGLRDQFAGQALAGLLAHKYDAPDSAAFQAYRFADAMLAARKGGAQ
ncbi:Arc family DNA-binding protein [Sinorhizobium medicae]|nr:Arc family DNA-binding protein [Sinorhizobium medicae]